MDGTVKRLSFCDAEQCKFEHKAKASKFSDRDYPLHLVAALTAA
jgi:hypothetical protein